MTAAVDELKVRARVRLSAARRAGQEGRLRDYLHGVSHEVGFFHWDHARKVLAGEAAEMDDMGTFWHAPRCSFFLSQWYSRQEVARQALALQPAAYLLPYRRQFVLVRAEYLRELGLDPLASIWSEVPGRDLVAAYGSAAWQTLSRERLRAPLSSFAPIQGARAGGKP